MIADAIQQECENLLSEISSLNNDAITNHIPSQVDSSVRDYRDNPPLQQDDFPIWLALKYQFERLHVATTPCRPYVVRPRDKDDPHDDAHFEGENSVKRQKMFEHGTFVFRESSSGQEYECKPGPSMSGNQDQSDDFDFWTNSYAIDNDVLPNKKVSQELVDEMSQIVDEAKLRKVKGNIGPEKIVLSLHKLPAVRFPDDDIEERTSIWSDYKNLNKNDIEDMYLLIVKHKVDDYDETGLLWLLLVFIRSTVIWERVHDFQLGVESYQQNVNRTVPIITFPGIEKYKMFSIVSDLVYGIIYENSKKENRVMRHQEIHKFCDATLKRVLEGLKSYNNDVKYGYVTSSLSKEDD
ncbi:hypothetical protein Tco_1289162 [Tanacetum coccineum]